MESSVLHGLLTFITQHPLLSGLVVFITCFAESLAIVGLFMPGVALMFSFGMLIGGGQMDFASTMAWAVMGAIAGDGISFWIGHHYREHLRVMWPFSRYPKLLEKGTDFFTKHGGKSVVFGRFVGPVRPIIPVVAGMMGMSWLQFTLVNVISALLWAPFYLLPGMAFGASLGLAAEVAGRLVVLLLLVIALVWLVIWLMQRILHYLQPRTNPLIHQALRLTRNIPYFGAATEALLDPEHPESRVLTGLFLVLLVAMAALVFILKYTVMGGGPGSLNLATHNLIQGLRTEGFDQLMLWVTQFGSLYFLLPFTGVAILGLLLVRDYATVIYLTALTAFAQLSSLLLKNLTQVARPADLFQGLERYALPSSHAVMSTVFYGFLAVVFAARLPSRWRWLPYTLAAVLVSLVSFSRLYLGVHWLTDLLAGITIGLVWAALAGIAYRRHHYCSQHNKVLLLGSAVALVVGLLSYAYLAPVAVYLPASTRQAQQQVTQQQWLAKDWQQLPAIRHDLRGFNNQPFNLQWAGSRQAITQQLQDAGWQAVKPLHMGNLLHYLLPDQRADELPIPSHEHASHAQTLLYSHPLKDDAKRIAVIRLWPSSLRLGNGQPIWFGSISYMHEQQTLWVLHLLRTEADFSSPLRLLDAETRQGNCSQRQRPGQGPLLLCHG